MDDPNDHIAEYLEDGSQLFTLYPERDDLGLRLDQYVTEMMPDLSRTRVQGLIDDGRVLVDGRARKPKFRITPGEVVEVRLPPVVEDEIQPDPIPLNVVYENPDVIVIDKPPGMVVHPAPGHPRGTLANALIAHDPTIAVGGSHRPGIVHRLDKDTSGLIVAARTDRGRQSLLRQWGDQTVKKSYLALVDGYVEETEATIDAPIGRDPKNRQRMAVLRSGKPAITHFQVVERFPEHTLLEVDIETGRTHQIRVHLAFIGHPITGDATYGSPSSAPTGLARQFLHASELAFTLPDGSPVAFSAPLPDDLASILAALRSDPNSLQVANE
jgi:23S rRNA pseudouridine1911/1915/1917 synthase